jgi:hypothetical protein
VASQVLKAQAHLIVVTEDRRIDLFSWLPHPRSMNRILPLLIVFIPFGSNTPKLASAFAFGIMSDGKSLYSQKPQRVGSDVPSGMPGEVSTRSDER